MSNETSELIRTFNSSILDEFSFVDWVIPMPSDKLRELSVLEWLRRIHWKTVEDVKKHSCTARNEANEDKLNTVNQFI